MLYYIIFDELDGIILGLSVDEKPNDDWYEIDEETYNFILENNGLYIINLSTISKNIDVIKKENLILKQESLQDAITKVMSKNKTYCKMFINNGIYYIFDNKEKKHFTHKIEDQINFDELKKIIDNNSLIKTVSIKSSEELNYIEVSKDIFMDIYNKLMRNKFYRLFHLEAINNYVNSLNSIEEVYNVTYEMTLPKEYQDMIDNKMKNFFGEEVG